MIVIGITGSIGMGKSTIASMLRQLGIPIHDSDKVVKSLLDKNLIIIDKIKKKWPSCTFESNENVNINKHKLSQIIFKNKNEKKELEKILYPYVIESRNAFLRENRDRMMVGLDVPLLYETKTDKICNYIFLASTSKKNQKKRVLKRDNMNNEKFNNINKNQLSDIEKRKKNPIIITTQYGKILTFIIVILNLLSILIKVKSIKI